MAAIRNARASMSQTALKIDHLLCGRNIRERSSARDRQIIKDAGLEMDADIYQSSNNSYIHAMSSPDWTPSQAKERANRFVREWLNAARYRDRGHSAEAECTPWGRHDLALRCYGFALHTLQDSTSPAHKGFQYWDGAWGHHDPHTYLHIARELPSVRNGAELSELLNITWYSYAYYFKSRFELPTDFFSGQVDPVQESSGSAPRLRLSWGIGVSSPEISAWPIGL